MTKGLHSTVSEMESGLREDERKPWSEWVNKIYEVFSVVWAGYEQSQTQVTPLTQAWLLIQILCVICSLEGDSCWVAT